MPLPLSRRHVLGTAASAAAMAALPVSAQNAPPSLGSGALMRERATRFLASLDETARTAAQFDFGSPVRAAWTYMLGSRAAPGLALEIMSAEQKDLALDLLSAALGSFGMEKAQNIMLQQDILRDEWGKGSPDRNRERFSLQIYGTPSETGPWGWRWEGHHLSLSFTLLDDQLISITPNSFSSEPNTVPSGPHAGLVVLEEEEALGRSLFEDLSETQRQAALVAEASPGNVLTVAGQEDRYRGDARGLAFGDMSQGQIDMAERLMEVYGRDYLSEPYAAAQWQRMNEGDLMSARLVWAGRDLSDGNSIYYRIHGPTFLFEFASLRNQPLHLHTTFHDTERGLGRHLI